MPEKTANLIDLEFICKKVIWSLKLKPEKMMAYIRQHRMEAFYHLRNPKNGGLIIIGQEASRRFWDIAERHLAAEPRKKKRASLKAFVEELRTQFPILFLEKSREIDQAGVDEWISHSHAATEKHHDALTHCIPCGLILSDTVKEFTIGPVTFLHKAEFIRLYGAELERMRETLRDRHRNRVKEAIASGFPEINAATADQSAEWGNRLTDRLLETFKPYSWFAVVQFEPAASEVSRDRALLATRGAVNIVKLLLGSYYTSRLRTADDQGNAGPHAGLSRSINGELNVFLSFTPMDNVAGDQWHKLLTTTWGKYFTNVCRILTLSCDFDTVPPLIVRFMDALHWYGDAVSEKSLAAKIINYVTAIERICGTGIETKPDGKERGVTEIVSTRAAILYSVLTDQPFNRAKKEISRIYKLRSDLVRGSLSPFDDRITVQLEQVDTVTQHVLLAAIDYYGTLGLENLSLNEGGLRKAFLELEKWNATGRSVPSINSTT